MQLLLAAAVLGLGVCAAWPFRQGNPSLRPPPAAIPLELTLRRQDVILEASSAADVSPASGYSFDPPADPAGEPESSKRRALSELEMLGPPPPLPIVFQPVAPPVARSSPAPRPAFTTTIEPAPRAVDRRVQPREYRLRDGDTLESLAERFLGDATRAAEIYEANRAVLPSADLLPIGKTITIPPLSMGGDLEPVAAAAAAY